MRRVVAPLLTVLVGLALTACHASSPLKAQPGSHQGPPTLATCLQRDRARCYAPFQMQRAYDLTPLYAKHLDGHGRTIAIVDSFGSPTIRTDLARFDSDFHLPAPPQFRIIHPAGAPPRFDPSKQLMVGWALETTLDVEWAHALAPGASILLVETPVAETQGVHGFPQIVRAENFVIDHGLADVISQSFAATEETFPNRTSILGLRSALRNARAHGVTVVSATGDLGATSYTANMRHIYSRRVTNWPATDPLVTAVGGTDVHLDAQGNRTGPDTVWNQPSREQHPPGASSGGLSSVFGRPSYQNSVRGIVGAARGIPDVSMNAAAGDGVLVYESFAGHPGYVTGSGTSAAAPEFAAVVAIADQAAGRRLGLLNGALYRIAAQDGHGIVDVRDGTNTVRFDQGGRTIVVRGWRAGPGYDLATGLGTVDAAALVTALAA